MGEVTSIKKRQRRTLHQPSMRVLMANPEFRAMATTLLSRSQLANVAGLTYKGKRDLYEALGYARLLFPADYRSRFNRNAVAARIIEAKPQSTWRGGGEVIEDEDPNTETPFEKAWTELDHRLKLWSMFQRTDTLAGMGRFAILFMGGPGKMEQPLVRMTAEQLMYLTPYSEMDAQIQEYDIDPETPRFGRPMYYGVSRMTAATTIIPSPETVGQLSNRGQGGKRVHYTRVLHVADGLLDDHIFGLPRLERCWNLLDDLDKVTGGGAEAFWRRADAGLQVDVDPDIEMEPEDETALDQEIDEYLHRLRRIVRTKGVKMTPLTSPVAGIKDPIDGIMSQLSAGTGIPQRILMGSERGQLASTQDDDNWTQRIVDRRRDFAGPQVVYPFIDQLIALGALPKPKKYTVGWPEIDNLDEVQKAAVAQQWASINKDMGEEVVTPDEIRDRLLGLPPRTEAVVLAAAKNVTRFKKKWACLSVAQRMSYMVKNHPEEAKKLLAAGRRRGKASER
jgi:hypothetical protein